MTTNRNRLLSHAKILAAGLPSCDPHAERRQRRGPLPGKARTEVALAEVPTTGDLTLWVVFEIKAISSFSDVKPSRPHTVVTF